MRFHKIADKLQILRTELKEIENKYFNLEKMIEEKNISTLKIF